MKNFNLWGIVTLVTTLLIMIANLYENLTLYVIFCGVGLISLVLTINSIDNDK